MNIEITEGRTQWREDESHESGGYTYQIHRAVVTVDKEVNDAQFVDAILSNSTVHIYLQVTTATIDIVKLVIKCGTNLSLPEISKAFQQKMPDRIVIFNPETIVYDSILSLEFHKTDPIEGSEVVLINSHAIKLENFMSVSIVNSSVAHKMLANEARLTWVQRPVRWIELIGISGAEYGVDEIDDMFIQLPNVDLARNDMVMIYQDDLDNHRQQLFRAKLKRVHEGKFDWRNTLEN